jgi:hypothetical protein
MTFFVLIIMGVVLIVGLGILVVAAMRRSQGVVPDMADRQGAGRDRVVAVDDEGRPVTESQAGEDVVEPRDVAAFEDVLKDELKDLGH